MKITSRLSRLCFWSLRGAMVALAATICASAAAGPSESRATSTHRTHQKTTRGSCRVYLSGSGLPQPCDRLSGIPSTAIPMDIIGEYPVARVRK